MNIYFCNVPPFGGKGVGLFNFANLIELDQNSTPLEMRIT